MYYASTVEIWRISDVPRLWHTHGWWPQICCYPLWGPSMPFRRSDTQMGMETKWAAKNDETLYNVGPPSDVCWFISPSNYSYLRTINHSEIGVICTN